MADLITVSSDYAQRHLNELLAAAERGDVVRVLDLRRPSVRAWISTERPAALDGMPDDMALIQARTRRKLSHVARARRRRAAG